MSLDHNWIIFWIIAPTVPFTQYMQSAYISLFRGGGTGLFLLSITADITTFAAFYQLTGWKTHQRRVRLIKSSGACQVASHSSVSATVSVG